MRPLEKGPVPEVLARNESTWTLEYIAARQRGESTRGHWGDDEIREALRSEVNSKCAYCESFVRHVSYDHVEHIRPKSVYPDLAHRWPNLTAACQVCNVNKGDYDSAEQPLLNPYYDDPRCFIEFVGALALPRDDDGRGCLTYEKLQLYRWDLTQSRERRLMAVTQMFLRWRAAGKVVKETVAAGIVLDVEQGEYTVAAKSMLVTLGFPWPVDAFTGRGTNGPEQMESSAG